MNVEGAHQKEAVEQLEHEVWEFAMAARMTQPFGPYMRVQLQYAASHPPVNPELSSN
jgi:hypothetical protein